MVGGLINAFLDPVLKATEYFCVYDQAKSLLYNYECVVRIDDEFNAHAAYPWNGRFQITRV